MELLKNQKGITIVVFVVTIVIIIILATVSISAVFRNSGLIKKAQEAKEMTANSIIKEQEEINPSDGTTGAGTINVVFIDKNNQNKDKSKTYSETYPSYATGNGMTDYVVHPAFNFGGKKLAGIWVGKYETSNTDCTTTESTGQYNGTDKKVTIKAGVTSWRNITISNMFTVGINLNNAGNPYGLNTNDNVVAPHLMKIQNGEL